MLCMMSIDCCVNLFDLRVLYYNLCTNFLDSGYLKIHTYYPRTNKLVVLQIPAHIAEIITTI